MRVIVSDVPSTYCNIVIIHPFFFLLLEFCVFKYKWQKSVAEKISFIKAEINLDFDIISQKVLNNSIFGKKKILWFESCITMILMLIQYKNQNTHFICLTFRLKPFILYYHTMIVGFEKKQLILNFKLTTNEYSIKEWFFMVKSDTT